MKKKDTNKSQIVRIEQALESLKVATKSYLKIRDEQLAKLVIQSSNQLIREIEKDSQEIIYVSSLGEKGGVE